MLPLATSCKDDDPSLAKAVLASAKTLTFDGQNAGEQIITVYSDADWILDCPEWVTVTPSTGSGTTDVTVSVSDNLRDGSLDNPRKANVIFKGQTLASEATVVVSQKGDKYRDIANFTVSQIAAAADETVIIVPTATVVAVTTEGFVASDGNTQVYVLNTTPAVSAGDVVAFRGDKGKYAGLPAVTTVDKLTVTSHSAVTYPKATDITSTIDTYTSDAITYISALGVLNGNKLSVGAYSGKKFVIDATKALSINIFKAPSSLGVDALNGHIVRINGYFAGVAQPVLNVFASSFEDEGLFETIIFNDDFSWMQPYLDAYAAAGYGTVGDAVGTQDVGSSAPNVYSNNSKFVVNGKTIGEEFMEQGYVDLNPGPRVVYPQYCYWKMGKTGYHTGFQIPQFKDLTAPTNAKLSFNWCAQLTGAGEVDVADIYVSIVEGTPGKVIISGAESQKSECFTSDQKAGAEPYDLHWMTVTVELKGITAETKITIAPTGLSTVKEGSVCKRWYLDNIKVVEL